jgi:Trk K+ transport system NAD-binding subunit
MADPEIHEQLPLHKTHWVVSTVRGLELNLALLQLLKNRHYDGKLALTAANPEEAGLFEKAGAQVVLCPFSDAAEQAADSLTHAMDVLPGNIDWPISFRETRIQSGAVFAGKTVREIPIRAETGASILAVSRAGRVHYDPGPDFQIYPGDRLVIMGHPDELRKAEILLGELQTAGDADGTDHFVLAEIRVADDSWRTCRTLADLNFRQKYGVTVVGIRRGEERISTPGPLEQVCAGDRLVVIGSNRAVAELKQMESLQENFLQEKPGDQRGT